MATSDPDPTIMSRAVTRRIEPGANQTCPHCNERLKFQARQRADEVIANVYVDGRWDRVEHYHAACYLAAGEPYGKTTGGDTIRARRAGR